MKLRLNKKWASPKLKVKSPVPPGTEDETESEVEEAQLKRGPKSVLGECKRFSMFVPDDLKDDVDNLRRVLAKEDISVKLSLATVLREGARLFLAQKYQELKKARKGELHAKKR